MLGCCRIGEKFLNGFQENCPLLLRFWREVKNKRLKRPLSLLYVGLQGILFCGTLEAAPAIPCDVGLKGKDGCQVAVVVLKNDDGRGLAASGKTKQGIIKSSAEIGAGSGNAVSVVVAPSDEADKRSKQDGTKDGVGVGEEGFNHFAYWLIVIIALLPIWLSNAGPRGGLPEPNVLAKGLARFWASPA